MIKARIRQVIQKYNDNKNSAKRLLKWTGIAVGIGILFVLMLSVILFLAVIIGILILVSFLYTRRKRNRSNKFLDTGIFNLISSIISSRFWKNYYYSVSRNNYFYYCVSCGTKHKEVACPRCGSKFKKRVNA
jgi:ABC-type Fe3+ transport system permease subunit